MELIRKTILAGLGTAVVTRSKIKETMHNLVEQGKLTTEEAEKYSQELIEAGEKEFGELRQETLENLQSFASQMNLAKQDDLQALTEKVQNLEKRLDLMQEKLRTQNSEQE
ncbi:MAG: phasin family protein [Desulfohalobiaceae bacterium]